MIIAFVGVIMQRKCNCPGFGALIYVRGDRINPPMKYQKLLNFWIIIGTSLTYLCGKIRI